MNDQREVIEKNKSVDLNNHDHKARESSSSLAVAIDKESVLRMRSDEGGKNEGSKSVEELKEERSSSCVIDVKSDDEGDGEIVCRICHSGYDKLPERFEGSSKMKDSSLIELGCGCKDDLGVAHSHCAEAWFKLKGNRICEICGEPARNITGIVQEPRLVEWTEQRSYVSGESYVPEAVGGWWRGQPCCNFLLALLIVMFVIPWFFRAKVF